MIFIWVAAAVWCPCIEAPIDESERRISVPAGADVKYNSWITEQGLSDALQVEFPLGNGHVNAY